MTDETNPIDRRSSALAEAVSDLRVGQARTEGKIDTLNAKLDARFDTLSQKIDGTQREQEQKNTTIQTVIGTNTTRINNLDHEIRDLDERMDRRLTALEKTVNEQAVTLGKLAVIVGGTSTVASAMAAILTKVLT